MDNDLALLHQKIDHLTAQVDAQQQRLTLIENNGYVEISEKLDLLVEQANAQARQREEFNQLKNDLVPILNHMIKLSIDELAEIGSEFQGEDLLFLIKRLLRDTNLLVELLDRLERTFELVDETQEIGTQVFHQVVLKLDRMEQDGYFAFARSGWRIVERIVNEFSQEDVDALGDNIVTILTTVKNLTQPEIMAMTNNALQVMKEIPVSEEDISIWSLMRDLSDPQVRKGLSRLLNMVKLLAEQPGVTTKQ